MSRHQRVEEAIRKEVSLIIHDELKDPRIGFITITRVELTGDLRSAKVFYSVLGKEEEHKKTRLALDSALGYIRSLVAQRINLRIATELMLKEDHSTEYSVRIEEVLNQIKEIDEPKKGLRKRKKI
ncbi:MAG: 30S ribosome-binding factor RbfA [Candidatus Omnitrophota bacterium]